MQLPMDSTCVQEGGQRHRLSPVFMRATEEQRSRWKAASRMFEFRFMACESPGVRQTG